MHIYVHIMIAEETGDGADGAGAGPVSTEHTPRRRGLVDFDDDSLALAPDRDGMPVDGQVQVGFDIERAPH